MWDAILPAILGLCAYYFFSAYYSLYVQLNYFMYVVMHMIQSNTHKILVFFYNNEIKIILSFSCGFDTYILIIHGNIAKGELDPRLAGRFTSMVKNAALINPDTADPTILIESSSRNIVVKYYDNMTVTMSCLKSEEQFASKRDLLKI